MQVNELLKNTLGLFGKFISCNYQKRNRFKGPTLEFLRREMNFCATMAGDICIKGSCMRAENETLTLVSSICRSSVGQSHHVDEGPELF